MRRSITAAAIGLVGTVIALSPATAAFATGTRATMHATTTTHATTTRHATTTTHAVAPTAREHASRTGAVTVSSRCAYFCFVPAAITIAAGATITWTDRSNTLHKIARCDPANCNGVSGGTGTDANFTSADIAIRAGATAHFTFAQPGTYVYYCVIHGYNLMHGTITVTAAAVTSTTVPPTATPISLDPTTTLAGPHLASTGTNTSGALAASLMLVIVGLTATSFQIRRRYS